MKKPARIHHYLPQAYLAGFTDNGTKEGTLYVLKTETGRCFKTLPRNVAAERDFNRIEVDGIDSDALEQALSGFEDCAVAAVRRVALKNTFPRGDDFSYVVNLLGLLAIHNPQPRASFDHLREQVFRRIGEILVSDRKIWDHQVRKAREAGHKIREDVSFENVKRFVDSGDYEIEFNTEENLKTEFHVFDKLLSYLARRWWSLLIAEDGAPDFICSDYPVSVVWKDPAMKGPIGFGLSQTEVLFPLKRRQAFFGVFEDPLEVVMRVDVKKVGELNARTAFNANRHIYCAAESFVMLDQGHLVKVHCGSNQPPDCVKSKRCN